MEKKWFFENEIDIIDEFGNTIKNDVHKKQAIKPYIKLLKILDIKIKKYK